MKRGTWQKIGAGAASFAVGMGLAVVVAGAAADPSSRDVTIAASDKVLTIYGSPDAESLTISGRSAQCCITIDGTQTLSDFSDDCHDDGSGSFRRVICDTSKLEGIEAPLGDSNDVMSIVGRLPILTIRGETGADTIVGGESGEKLTGNSGNDKIRGGGGKDAINGGPGTDRCKGSEDATIRKCER